MNKGKAGAWAWWSQYGSNKEGVEYHSCKDDDLSAPIARMSKSGEDRVNNQQMSTSLKLEEKFSKVENGNQIILLVKYMEVLLDYILKWIIPGDGIFDIFESIIIRLIYWASRRVQEVYEACCTDDPWHNRDWYILSLIYYLR